MTRPTALALCVAIAASASLASAQDTWLILPVGIGEEPRQVADHARVTGAALETTVGATVLQDDLLRHRLENAVSLPYAEAPASELAAQLAAAEPEMLTAVSRGRSGEVITRVDELLEQARGSLAVQRDDEASTNLARVCAYSVRAYLDSTGEQDARERARECIALTPGFTLGERHPPNVRALYDDELRAISGTLVVSGSRDDPPGCTVRVGGRAVGQTPSANVTLPPGDYRVQVECSDAPGRVHAVHVGDEDAELAVRGTLDGALRTEPPALVYPSTGALQMLPGDLAHAARAVGANYALAVIQRAGNEGLMRSFRVTQDGPPQFLAERTFQLHGDPDGVRERAMELARSTLGEPSGSDEGEDGSVSFIGPTLLGIGGATLLAGAIVAGVLAAENDAFFAMCMDDRCPESARSAAENVHGLAIATDALLIGGGVLAAVGLGLTLFLRDEVEESSPDVTAGCGLNGCNVRVRGDF